MQQFTIGNKPVVLNLGVAIWTSMTFFFWSPHLILGGNLDICGRDDLFLFFCSSLNCGGKFGHDLFFALHFILGGNLDICGRDDFFFALLYFILCGNLDICGCDDLFFALHFILSGSLDICGFCSSPGAQLHLCVFNDS